MSVQLGLNTGGKCVNGQRTENHNQHKFTREPAQPN